MRTLGLYIHHPKRLDLGSTSYIPPDSGTLISVVKLIDLCFDPVLLSSWMEDHQTGMMRGELCPIQHVGQKFSRGSPSNVAQNYLHLDQNAPSLRRWLQPRAYWASAIILYRHVRKSTMPNMLGCIRDRKEVTACYLPS